MTSRQGWSIGSTVGVLVLGFALPARGEVAPSRLSGSVVAVDRGKGAVTIEEIAPWRVKDGRTVITRVTVEMQEPTVWTRARRADGAGPSGWKDEFIEVPQRAWDLKPGDYVTVELQRAGKRRVAGRLTVSELDTR